MSRNLYIITVFGFKEKTDEDYEKEAKIRSIRYNRNITAEDVKNKPISKSDAYDFWADEVSFHDNFESANEFLENNVCDVWETCYHYGAILELPFGAAYPQIYATNLYLYKYIYEKDGYELISKEDFAEEEYEAITSYFGYNEEIAAHYRKQNEEE